MLSDCDKRHILHMCKTQMLFTNKPLSFQYFLSFILIVADTKIKVTNTIYLKQGKMHSSMHLFTQHFGGI